MGILITMTIQHNEYKNNYCKDDYVNHYVYNGNDADITIINISVIIIVVKHDRIVFILIIPYLPVSSR